MYGTNLLETMGKPTAGHLGMAVTFTPKAYRELHEKYAAPFTNRALLQQQDILRVHVDKLITALRAKARNKESVNMGEWSPHTQPDTYTTFDIIGDICFAEPFGCLDGGESNEWARAIINIFKAATWDQAIRRVAGTGTLLHKALVKIIIPAEAAQWRTIHFSNSKAKTLARLADPDRQHPDLIKHILDSEDSRAALSPTEIILNMPRVVPACGAVVAGCPLPSGTTVSVAPWAAVFSARNFADPERFAPERWLDEGGADPRYAADRRGASQPFSTGPRGCMGKNLAYFELRLVLAHLLWHFDLEPTDSAAGRECMRRWEQTDMDTYQTWMKPDLWVDLKEAQR
uniref:Uncharacterized protein n=1 Tax=Pyricularia oryzae (strain P131) TaxID=1143193 RepID=L7J1E3_PYRO1